MKRPRVLYSSSEIHACIKRLFSNPHANDRRVALVAYVGKHAQSYLAHPEGLEVVCNPSAGGTHPDAVRNLMKHHAQVRFSDALHMKVYWSRQRGCVVTSANASANALGVAGLKEAGVLLPPGAVDIQKLLKYARPRKITPRELWKLDSKTRVFTKHIRFPRVSEPVQDYLQWFKSPHRSHWKLGWTDHEVSGTAKAVKAETAAEYARKQSAGWVATGKNRVKQSDFLLTFHFTEKGIRDLDWLYVDFIVKVSPKEAKFYDRDWPFHAVQVHQDSKCPPPPFKITREFRSAFASAVKEYGPEKIQEAKTDNPPKKLLDMVARKLKQEK